MQLYPGEPKGHNARMLTTLAAMVSGIVLGKSCQLPTTARKTPDDAKPDSRIKRFSRWLQNERVEFEICYLPFVQELLYRLASIRELVFIDDHLFSFRELIVQPDDLISIPNVWFTQEGCDVLRLVNEAENVTIARYRLNRRSAYNALASSYH